MKNTFCFALAVAMLVYSPALLSQDKKPGKWIKGSFAQYNLWCTQAWQCVPGQDVLHGPNSRVVTTAADSTQGVCNAAGGPSDSCNVCSASPPKAQCQYWLERR
jgi:hypothetical protein